MNRRSCDVLVVGAGPAGLAAAATAARERLRVLLVDENGAPGGQIWRRGISAHVPAAAARWMATVRDKGVLLLPRARVVAAVGPTTLLAETAEGPLELQGSRVILACGARECFLPFPGWTLPGVTGAGGLQTLVKGGLPIEGRRVVVAGTGPLLLAAADFLRRHGARIVLIAEQTTPQRLAAFTPHLLREPALLRQAAAYALSLRHVRFRPDAWITRAHGTDRLEAVTVQTRASTHQVRCSYLAYGYGLVPNLELPALLGCHLRDGTVHVDAWQQTSVPDVFSAGETTGIGGVDAALVQGQIAGYAVAGKQDAARALFPLRARTRAYAAALARAFSLRAEVCAAPPPETILCRCEDVPLAAIAGLRDWREAKLQTRCGMGPCQGRICGAAAGVLFGWETLAPRPPVLPATLATLAEWSSSAEALEDIR
jgi:NADPH-dependent 2,4-dienoyl-CoA reductase/sulfur reductase-like enzyme